MDDMQFGELCGKVNSIKENTDKIPDLCVRMAQHELRIAKMEPLVDNHEKTAQRAVGIAAVSGFLASTMAWFMRGQGH